MPSSIQRATVPAAPKSMSSGCAATASARATSGNGWTDRGKVTGSPGSPRSQGPTSGTQDQQGELGAVRAQGTAEAVEDLPLAGEHQPGTAGGDAGRADLLGDGRPFLPQPDDRLVNLVDPGPQVRDMDLRIIRGPGGRRLGRGLAQHRAAHFSAPSGRCGSLHPRSTERPGLVSPGRS